MKIIVDVCTKNRYFTTLPLTIQSIISQTRTPDKLIIYDDGEHLDLRKSPLYNYLFHLLDKKNIKWEVLFGEGKGQHYGHQKIQEIANKNNYDYVWRIDDDEVAEPNCLEELIKGIKDCVACAGLVIDPLNKDTLKEYSKSLSDIHLPNIQWFEQEERFVEVKHLYSSFLYKPGLVDYNLALSPVAHREETMFSHLLSHKGKLVVNTKAKTWHFRNPDGGIREEKDISKWQHDEEIFDLFKKYHNKKIAVLDNGLGDHIVFRKILDDGKLDFDVLAVCYPDVFEDLDVELISIKKSLKIALSERFDVYKYMDSINWKKSLYDAYIAIYEELYPNQCIK